MAPDACEFVAAALDYLAVFFFVVSVLGLSSVFVLAFVIDAQLLFVQAIDVGGA